MSNASAQSGEAEIMPYEEAMKQLESIVEAMESGGLSLEDMLVRYEDGMKLARLCQARLDEAAVKVEKLEKALGGELTVKPFDPSPATA